MGSLATKRLNKLDSAISEFFEKVDRRGRIARRLHQAMDKSAEYLKPKVSEWLENMRRKIVGDLTRKFAKDRALDITTTLTDWEWIEDNGKKTLKPALLTVVGNGGDEAFVIGGIEARFDVLNPKSVAWAEKHCAKLVKQITDETRNGVKEIIRRGIKEGKAMPRIAKEIRPIVGLTERQMMAAANHEEWLIANRPELSPREVSRRTDVYARRMHRRRADMIARTESAYAVDEGTLQGYEQAEVERVEWLTAEADACDYCMEMNGKKFKLEEAHGMMPAHPDCRCAWAPTMEERAVIPKIPSAENTRSTIIKTQRNKQVQINRWERKREQYSDKFTVASNKKDWAEANKYARLMDKAAGKSRDLRLGLNEELRKKLYVSEKGFKLAPDWRGKVSKEMKTTVEGGLDTFGKMVDEKIILTRKLRAYQVRKMRSYYGWDKSINMGRLADKGSVIHEMGHWLEDTNSEIHRKVVAFLKKRTAGLKAVRLKDGFAIHEMTKRDKFIDQYMGKMYADYRATEVLSMGLQYYYSDPYKLALKDPKYFDFIFNLVRGL